jgi:hypothetical protein
VKRRPIFAKPTASQNDDRSKRRARITRARTRRFRIAVRVPIPIDIAVRAFQTASPRADAAPPERAIAFIPRRMLSSIRGWPCGSRGSTGGGARRLEDDCRGARPES